MRTDGYHFLLKSYLGCIFIRQGALVGLLQKNVGWSFCSPVLRCSRWSFDKWHMNIYICLFPFTSNNHLIVTACFLSLCKASYKTLVTFLLSLKCSSASAHLYDTPCCLSSLSLLFSRRDVWFSWSVGLTVKPSTDDWQQPDGTVFRWTLSLTE